MYIHKTILYIQDNIKNKHIISSTRTYGHTSLSPFPAPCAGPRFPEYHNKLQYLSDEVPESIASKDGRNVCSEWCLIKLRFVFMIMNQVYYYLGESRILI